MSAAPVGLRELDLAIAREVLGWKVIKSKLHPTMPKQRLPGGKTGYHLAYANGEWAPPNHSGVFGWGWTDSEENAWLGVPAFTASLDACRIAELEMRRRGFAESYARALMESLDPEDGMIEILQWRALVYADAEMRCLAMLAAVRNL